MFKVQRLKNRIPNSERFDSTLRLRLGCEVPEQETLNTEPEALNTERSEAPEQETLNTEPGTLNTERSEVPERRTLNPEPGTMNAKRSEVPERRTLNIEQGTLNAKRSEAPEQETLNPEPGTLNTERSEAPEQETLNPEPGTLNTNRSEVPEQETLNTKPGTLNAKRSETPAFSFLTFNSVAERCPERSPIGVEGPVEASFLVKPHGACTLISTTLLREAGGYDEKLKKGDGDELANKLGHLGAVHIKTPLFLYRQHGGNLSGIVSKQPINNHTHSAMG